jgi:uncharacterized protein YegL
MAPYTDITILLDRSGSMTSIKDATEAGFKEFIQQHRAVPSTRLTLAQFDGENAQDVVYTEVPVADIAGLTLDPRGMTPLNDAVCRTIDATGARLAAKPEAERPEKVLFLIITDGQENASHTFTRKDVRARIERQHGTYNWQFAYLGANQDAFKEAETMGIPKMFALNYTASREGTRGAWRGVASTSTAYVANLDKSATLDAFTPEQQHEALQK